MKSIIILILFFLSQNSDATSITIELRSLEIECFYDLYFLDESKFNHLDSLEIAEIKASNFWEDHLETCFFSSKQLEEIKAILIESTKDSTSSSEADYFFSYPKNFKLIEGYISKKVLEKLIALIEEMDIIEKDKERITHFLKKGFIYNF